MKTVIIQGLGFVGAAMAVAASNALDIEGFPFFNVIGVDLPTEIGKQRVEKINSGLFPFETLDKKIISSCKKAVKRGNLSATTDENVFKKADVILVSINLDLTFKKSEPIFNLVPFKEAIYTLGKHVKKGSLIIIETTVPPGTCEKVVKPIIRESLELRNIDVNSVHIAHSYERVMPGANYLDSIINFWRVYSGTTPKAANLCKNFLSKIINVKKYLLTKLESTTASETAKVLENSYRAVNIAFIEEWSRFSESAGINLYDVIDAIRIRPTHSNIRQPGFGVGGYCLTKDPLFAKIAAKDIFGFRKFDFPFSSKAIETNKVMPLVTLKKLQDNFKGSLLNKKILLMGISYREDVGDTRFTPAEIFYKNAIKKGAKIIPHDPLVKYWDEVNTKVLSEIPNPNTFDAIVFTVRHSAYSKIKFNKWLKPNSKSLIFDANNVLKNSQRKDISKMGIKLLSIGRGEE